MGVVDDGVEVDHEIQKSDCWGAGVSVVGTFVASDCQTNKICFSLGQLDVADKVGVGSFLTFGYGLFGYKKDCVATFNLY